MNAPISHKPSRLSHRLPAEARTLSREAKPGRWLRYRADRWSVAIAVGCVAAHFGSFASGTLWLWPLALAAVRWAHLVQHNHAHLPIFRSNFLNELLGFALGTIILVPLELHRYQHVQVHHTHEHTPEDWTGPFALERAQYPNRPISKLLYLATYIPVGFAAAARHFFARRNTRAGRRFWLQLAGMAVVSVLLCLYNPLVFLVYFPLSWIVSWVGASANNWGHHVDCPMDSVFTGSNTDLRLLCRGPGLNIGYHAAHHWHPTLHWSLLPELHWRFMADQIPAERYGELPPDAVGLPKRAPSTSPAVESLD